TALTSTSTSPLAGTGLSTSRTSSTSMSPYWSNLTALLTSLTTSRRALLFRDCDPDTDFFYCHQVSEHFDDHLQVGVAVALQERLDTLRHLGVHAAVDVDDQVAVRAE